MKPVVIALLIVVFIVISREPDDDGGRDGDTNPSSNNARENDDDGDDGDDGDDNDAPPDTGADGGVVLTFDASPHPMHTPALLDILAKRDITAEFCVTDARAAQHGELVNRIVREGHSLCTESISATQVRLAGDKAATVDTLPQVIRDVRAAGYSLSR